MTKRILLIPLFILFLSGCNTITNDDLIGGTWIPTEGNNAIQGEYNCEKFKNGLQFISEEKAIKLDTERIYEYELRKRDSQYYLYLHDPRTSIIQQYPIDKLSKHKIEFKKGGIPDTFSCYMERSQK